MLPIESVSPEVLSSLSHSNVVLVAPPGAGKSTYLPLQLLSMDTVKTQTVIMLQPRRVAARAIAEFLASQLGEKVGQTVGYKIRGESKSSVHTRLLIVTEGLLVRMIQSDPELTGIGLIIFDEFHERNIHADLSLALSLDVQQNLRDDLRLLVMSATLEAQSLLSLMPDAKMVQSEGKQYPVDTFYQPISKHTSLSEQVASCALKVLASHTGSVLIFLPGARDINRVFELLVSEVDGNTHVFQLHGTQTKAQQLAAIAPCQNGQRKVVLSTNIAETSLTIDGISTVIDSGLEKVSRFNLKRGLSQLLQQPISQASSIQRQGRAGRLGPGQCYRLWPQDKQARLAKHGVPEILEQDISNLLLTVMVWGSTLDQLALLDMPTSAQVEQAKILLSALGALDEGQKLTKHGRKMAELGCHPRLANMLLVSSNLSQDAQHLACIICALLERQVTLDKSSSRISDQIEALTNQRHHPTWAMAKQWAKRLGLGQLSSLAAADHNLVAVLIGFAFPDQIAKNRGKGRFILTNGGGANLKPQDPLQDTQWLTIADLQLGQHADALITLAEPIAFQRIDYHFGHMFKHNQVLEWHDKQQKITALNVKSLGAITLSSEPDTQVSSQQYIQFWLQLIGRKGLASLGWKVEIANWLAKVALARKLLGETWPDLSLSWLEANLESWLSPYLSGVVSWKALTQLNWLEILTQLLDWDQQSQLRALFPKHYKVATGNQYKLEYSDDGEVNLSVRMQEMYGVNTTPTIANGRLPIAITLLSPAGRPLQKTQNLASFWTGSYIEIQKEMKGRYPKHFWPDDPANAKPTDKVKSRM